MKISELITELQQHDPNAEIGILHNNFYNGERVSKSIYIEHEVISKKSEYTVGSHFNGEKEYILCLR